MERRLIVLVLLTALHTPVLVSGVTLTVTDDNLNEGDILTISCQEQNLGTDVNLFAIWLEKANPVSQGGYGNVLRYDLIVPPGDSYKPTWDTGVERRANATPSFTSSNGGSFTMRFGPVQCSDAGAFRCGSSITASQPDYTPARNVTIHGITNNVRISGALDCNTFEDPDCAQCQNFIDPAGDQPKYAPMAGPLKLTCEGQFATPGSFNRITWYRQSRNDVVREQILVNTTDFNYDPPTSNPCTVSGRSTLDYYPKDTDRELTITCEVSYQGSTQVYPVETQLCVEGLIVKPVTQGPGGNQGPSTAGLGGGPIAGIVIGVIAVIVLVVVLVYFLWYRRRDSGESYNTREADGRGAPPPVAKKPEMHENSMYDSTGDPHQNNYNNRYDKYDSGPGKVNRAMDDEYYHNDNDTAPRAQHRDPIGSSV